MDGGKIGGGIAVAVLILAAICGIVWAVGSANPETGGGYVGYLTRGAVFGKTEFVGLQTGPTSPGRGWLLQVVNVSVTPYTETEEFSGTDSVLSKDNLKISFRLHMVWRVHPERVKLFIEQYSTLHEGQDPNKVVEVAYNSFLREPLRTMGRDSIQKFGGLDIKENIISIGSTIQKQAQELTKDTPFEVQSVVVGNIQYPDVVTNAVSEKMAMTQKLEQMKTELQIEEMKKQRRVIEAQGIAAAMDIINSKLSPMYLQHEAIEAQKAMVGSANHTTIYIPVGPMGVPIIGTMDIDGAKEDKKQSESPK